MPVGHSLHYHVDFAATVIELAGGKVSPNWDGQSFANALKSQTHGGRDFLVISQGAWSCQRAVRFDDWLCIKSYHDGYHGFPNAMLFDVKSDPPPRRRRRRTGNAIARFRGVRPPPPQNLNVPVSLAVRAGSR